MDVLKQLGLFLENFPHEPDEDLKKNLFSVLESLCMEYMKTVEDKPRLFRQTNVPYGNLPNILRFVPEERVDDRLLLTKCLQLFNPDLDLKPNNFDALGQANVWAVNLEGFGDLFNNGSFSG
tara:strand:+ start:522 stop:887 length:366 start_codon:yes stop_codon:yes gene_type:complete